MSPYPSRELGIRKRRENAGHAAAEEGNSDGRARKVSADTDETIDTGTDRRPHPVQDQIYGGEVALKLRFGRRF